MLSSFGIDFATAAIVSLYAPDNVSRLIIIDLPVSISEQPVLKPVIEDFCILQRVSSGQNRNGFSNDLGSISPFSFIRKKKGFPGRNLEGFHFWESQLNPFDWIN